MIQLTADKCLLLLYSGRTQMIAEKLKPNTKDLNSPNKPAAFCGE